MKTIIAKAEEKDLEAILELQYLAYQCEAKMLNDFSIQPLTQTIDEVIEEYHNGIFLKSIDERGNIVGSVRAYIIDDTAFIGKLFVNPQVQGKGIGTKLLLAIEKECNVCRYELFTSSKSIRNLMLYERLGYSKFKEIIASPDFNFIYLEKHQLQNNHSVSCDLDNGRSRNLKGARK